MLTTFLDLAKEIEKNSKLIINPSLQDLRNLAKKDELTTEYGSASYVTKIRNRSAKFTQVILDKPTEEQLNLVKEVTSYLKNKELILVERDMCQSKDFELKCKVLITKDYARIPFMWHKSLFPPKKNLETDMTTIYVPEWKQKIILVDAKNYVTFILGTDYFGECKKSNLRMAMHIMKTKHGGIGLHAGSKLLIVRDKDNKINKQGFLLFGLSGTGKTTLTVHDHNLKGEETVIIKQDDVVLLNNDAYGYGTEEGFYIKTENLTKDQEVLYNAAVKPTSVFENVHVEKDGKVDFLKYELTTNGRCMILRSDIPQIDDNVNLRKTDKLIFITRRKDIVPPIAKLNDEQAAAAFMLGESIETSAGDPTKAGQSKRVVGTNPFIMGTFHEEGHRFYDIVKSHKDIECYIMNTGSVGGEKITIKDSTRIMEHIARGTIKWKTCEEWHYQIAEEVPGVEKKKLDAANYYDKDTYKKLVDKLRQERIEYFKKFPELKKEIVDSLFVHKE